MMDRISVLSTWCRHLPFVFAASGLSPMCLLVPTDSTAQDRVAFVVGNDAYPDAPLKNAVRDSQAVKAMLEERLGFPSAGIVEAINADRLTLFESFETFKTLAEKAQLVVFYYAGHGMESLDGKENFLMPVDAPVRRAAQSEAVLRASGVNLMQLSSELAQVSVGAKVILMDCCRERPSGRGKTRAGGGLVTYPDSDIPADTLMILAAAPNRLASDGEEHGPFTEALLEVLPGNSGNLMDAFFAVSDRVQEVTQHRQIPWLKFDGSGQIFRRQRFLNATAVASAASPSTLPAMPVTSPSTTTAAPRTAPVTLREATKEAPFINSLGLEFIPVPGKTGVWMARSETRVKDFRAFVQSTDHSPTGGALVLKIHRNSSGAPLPSWDLDMNASWEKPGFPQAEDHPVTCVSWEEAKAFASWLSQQEAGLIYRLPTHLEWEAAADRLGKYPWGDSWPPPPGSGNYWDQQAIQLLPGDWESTVVGGSRYDDGASRTAPVRSYAANRFGFFDLGGNVWEWCEDLYQTSMNEPSTLKSMPSLAQEKASDGTPFRVLCGAAWSNSVETQLRSSYRNVGHPTSRLDFNGFRLVVSVDPESKG